MSSATRTMRKYLGLALVALVFLPACKVWAEQADRTKPINIEFDVATLDQTKRVRTLEGNVVLTQGTMRVSAERMVVKEDEAGFVTAQAFGGPKGQVTFRQKREGTTDVMEGYADRAEFDDQADTLKLLSHARLKSGGDELKGEYIYYNSATEVMQARNAIPDASGSPSTITPGKPTTRPTITIQPDTPKTN
ncbi:MAG: lipopolysaccharide transport periplasmic protein LptA [Usitatibacteraceae bacterium]